MDKTDLLYDHYKETYSILKENIIQRNHFFLMVFFVMALQFLFAASPKSISSLIVNIIQKRYEINIDSQISVIQSFLWFVLLYVTMRYYQLSVYIEKTYHYISIIESDITDLVQIRFDRESGNYLLNYPKMNDFIDILYKWIFPIIYCMVIFYKIVMEYKTSALRLQLILNTVLFISCFALTILYLCFLHEKRRN